MYFIIGILIILVIAGFFLYATGFDPCAPQGSGESKTAVRAFIGDPNAVVIFKKSYKNVIGESYDIYRVNTDEFTVDPTTGSVVGASLLSVPRLQNKNLYIQQTESNAKDFAARHYNDFYSRTMMLTELKEWDYGFSGNDYSFTWTEQSMGSNTSNSVRVVVNTDGKVLYYFARDKTPPTVGPVMVGKDLAVEIATNEVIGTAKYRNEPEKFITTELTVMPDHRVVWVVGLQFLYVEKDKRLEANPSGIIYIDAMTGEVLESDRCCS
jgi:hypothetical protein